MKKNKELFEESMNHVRGGGFGGDQDKLFKKAENGNYFRNMR